MSIDQKHQEFLKKIEESGISHFKTARSLSKHNTGILNSIQDSSPKIDNWKRVILPLESKEDAMIVKDLYLFAKNELNVEFDLTFWPNKVVFELDWSFKEI